MISTPLQTPSYSQGFARGRGQSACPELWDGLVGLWAPLLGPTGSTVFNWSLHGQPHNGTLTGMDPAADWVGTRYGWALDLPASSGYVDCGKPPALAISGRPNVTIAAWIKPYSLVDFGALWDNCYGGGANTVRFHFGMRNDYLRLLIGDGAAYSTFNSDLNALSPGRWVHVGLTISGDNEIVFYRNGLPHGAGTLDRDLASSTESWKIGRPFMISSYGLSGLMPFLAVYDRVLPPGAVARLCSMPPAPLCLRRRVVGILPAIGGPYRVAAGDLFHTGATEGGTFSTGSVIGECHGRSG